VTGAFHVGLYPDVPDLTPSWRCMWALHHFERDTEQFCGQLPTFRTSTVLTLKMAAARFSETLAHLSVHVFRLSRLVLIKG